MLARHGFRFVTLGLAAGLALGACSSGSSSPSAAAASAVASPSAAATSAVTGITGVKLATIQIEAKGSFVDPAVGQVLNAPGRGSGFILDASGLAVTNNHVVTGAALLQVWVGGEREPRNAKVVAVSECSDLAVIDIEGDGYPVLGWYEGDLTPGLDVYAAGFPLGDPEYTLTRGIISKARAGGDTSWASVDAVIEHDAQINPGNSGGPLVDAAGRVVGINYAGNDANQSFAVSRDEARKVLDELLVGRNVTSLGINGEAIDDGQGLTGIWVSSVESGSPADTAQIRGGDVITKLAGLVMATDGTMADYCDILRSHDPTDVLDVEVVRFSSSEVLEGQLNGRPVELSFSFAQEYGGDTGSTGAGTGSEPAYADYKTVTDDSKAIAMDVPSQWDDVSGIAWTRDKVQVGVSILASPNIEGWYDSWSVPGAFFGASRDLAASLTPAQYLASDVQDFSDDCTDGGLKDYEDPLYSGAYHLWTECGADDAVFIDLAVTPSDGALLLVVQITAVERQDLDALDRILDTFQVTGSL